MSQGSDQGIYPGGSPPSHWSSTPYPHSYHGTPAQEHINFEWSQPTLPNSSHIIQHIPLAPRPVYPAYPPWPSMLGPSTQMPRYIRRHPMPLTAIQQHKAKFYAPPISMADVQHTNSRRLLSDEEKREIIAFWDAHPGLRQVEIAKRFCCDRSTISKVVKPERERRAALERQRQLDAEAAVNNEDAPAEQAFSSAAELADSDSNLSRVRSDDSLSVASSTSASVTAQSLIGTRNQHPSSRSGTGTKSSLSPERPNAAVDSPLEERTFKDPFARTSSYTQGPQATATANESFETVRPSRSQTCPSPDTFFPNPEFCQDSAMQGSDYDTEMSYGEEHGAIYPPATARDPAPSFLPGCEHLATVSPSDLAILRQDLPYIPARHFSTGDLPSLAASATNGGRQSQQHFDSASGQATYLPSTVEVQDGLEKAIAWIWRQPLEVYTLADRKALLRVYETVTACADEDGQAE